MGKKDKFAQMQQGGGAASSFQDMLQTVTTVAAIERQQEEQTNRQSQQPARPTVHTTEPSSAPAGSPSGVSLSANPQTPPRFMRLPNPQIPLHEYNLVSNYCNTFINMTRQDFVELAIIEKLHNDGQLSDDEFAIRQEEIRRRLPRGQRKGTRNSLSSTPSSDSSSIN